MPDAANRDYMDAHPIPRSHPPTGPITSVTRGGVTMTFGHAPAATDERLALAVELADLVRPARTNGSVAFNAYADDLETIASAALDHCQRLERELDELRAGASGMVRSLDDLTTRTGVPELVAALDRLTAALTPDKGEPTAAEVRAALTGPAPAWLKMDTRP